MIFLVYTIGEQSKNKRKSIMGLHRDYEDNQSNYDYGYDDNSEDMRHKKHVRRMLEEKLERKRLKSELEDDFDDEFDWSDVGR